MPQNNDISKIPKLILLFIIHTIYVKIVYNFVCRTAKYYSTYAAQFSSWMDNLGLNFQFINSYIDIFVFKNWLIVALIHII